MNNQLTDLQSQLAFQEDAISALNKTVARQDRELAEIRHSLQQLAGALREMSPTDSNNPEHEIPPHY